MLGCVNIFEQLGKFSHILFIESSNLRFHVLFHVSALLLSLATGHLIIRPLAPVHKITFKTIFMGCLYSNNHIILYLYLWN